MNDAIASLPGFELPEFPKGLVWLVGAGPGDPGLMTLHGLCALSRADVIVADALADPRLLAWAPQAKVIDMGKRGGKTSPKQDEISAELIAQAKAGHRVLRLKGGDPFVFGLGAEEAEALVAAGVPFRVTPGVSAGIGGLAYAGIPVTHKDLAPAVTLVTGHDKTGEASGNVNWAALARGSPTIVAYMAVRPLARITAALIAGGRAPDTPVAVVQNATRPNMAVLETTLEHAVADLEASDLGSPAIVCIGQVVGLRPIIDWLTPLTTQD